MAGDESKTEPVIKLEDAGKCYRIFARQHHRLLQPLLGWRRSFCRDFWALRHVSLEVAKGETVGILGQNGSGKSTLLQLVAGTLPPSEGVVRVAGRVAALLELGSGFNPEFTGRENVYLNGSILGISREQMAERFDAIAAFAEIGDFVDRPVKTYSSGMVVRLAFSVAINVSPEVLIVDEALSVGDARFQQRCMTRIRQMRDEGVSILFVTHDIEACKRLCQRVYVLDKGSMVNSGPADLMGNWYVAFLTSLDNALVRMSTQAEPGTGPSGQTDGRPQEFCWFRHGDGNGVIEQCELLDANGQPVPYATMDAYHILRFHVRFNVKLDTAIFGFHLRDRLGTDLYGVNTFQEKTPFPPVEPGTRLTIDVKLPLPLRPSFYSISPALAYNQHEMRYLDYIHHALVFKVADPQPQRTVFGLFHPRAEISVRKESSDPAEPPPEVAALPDREAAARIQQMYEAMRDAPPETLPSRFWIELNRRNLDQLKAFGFENFKQTLALNYFTWLVGEKDEQVKFLRANLDAATAASLAAQAQPATPHKLLTAEQSRDYNLLTLMLWEYAVRQDSSRLLETLEEPRIGNPPEIVRQNRLISQDLANSFLEYQAIMQSGLDPAQLRTIWELGAGYGRTAFVFLKLLPHARYIVVDIPPALYVAERYLSAVFPQKRIFRFRPFGRYEEIRAEFEQAELAFLLPQQALLLPDKMADLFVSISSLHEMRPERIEYYFGLVDRLTQAYMYIKQWKTTRVPFEDVEVRESDYPFRAHWSRVFQRECRVQTYFFEALLRLET